MNYRAFIVVCLLLIAVAFNMAMAQGVVVESVDEDVVEGDAPPPAAVDKSKSAAKDSVVDKKSAANKKTTTADSSAAQKKPPVKKELDLDALLVEDDEEDLLVEEKKVAAPAARDSVSADTSANSGELAGEDKTPAADSAAQASPGRRGGRGSPAPKAAAAKPAPADLGPTVIEDGRSINFAHNLKEYRSPRIAMLLSLLVPGLGQAYSRSYIKAGAFGAAEIATVAFAVYYNYKGNKEYDKAKDFADANYDVNRIKTLDSAFQKNIPDTVKERVDYDSSYYASFYSAADAKESYYYESIRGRAFTPGWKDSDPALNDLLNLIEGRRGSINANDGGEYIPSNIFEGSFYWLTRMAAGGGSVLVDRTLGYSSDQTRYNSMMDKSSSYHDIVNYTFYVLLLNHIASAVDAGFTARAYNAKLLGQESAWNRLSVEQVYVYSGSEASPGIAVRWRF